MGIGGGSDPAHGDTGSQLSSGGDPGLGERVQPQPVPILGAAIMISLELARIIHARTAELQTAPVLGTW
jgi:hypothetical protein